MGVTFRSGNYIKFVRFGGRTIKDGEAAAIWNRKGVHTQIIGPRRANLCFSTIRFLTRHKAESHQYLVVKHRDGRVEHIRGPVALFENPALHDQIRVEDSILLKSDSEYIVVYNEGTSNHTAGHVQREKMNVSANRVIIHGPTLFVPTPIEHVHEFSWSQVKKGEQLSSTMDKFRVLRTTTLPLEITLNVPLSDSHCIKAELHIEYKISSHHQSVETLVKHEDPIRRMYKAILADGQKLGDSITLDMIRARKQSEMNALLTSLESYTELRKAAEQSGLQITSVYLTSQDLNDPLKKLFDNERKLAGNLQSEIERNNQRRELRALEQEDMRKGIEDDAELQRMKLESDDKLDQEMHEIKLAALKRRVELEKHEAEASNEKIKMKDATVLLFLDKVKDMGVDMTKFLASANGSDSSNIVKRATFIKGITAGKPLPEEFGI